MQFICDVHISIKVVKYLVSQGFTTIHVNSILNKWHTTDKEISEYADLNDFTLITKDSDFRDSYFIKHTPKKLIKINLGNISNEELIEVFGKLITNINTLEKKGNFLIEVDKNNISVIT